MVGPAKTLFTVLARVVLGPGDVETRGPIWMIDCGVSVLNVMLLKQTFAGEQGETAAHRMESPVESLSPRFFGAARSGTHGGSVNNRVRKRGQPGRAC
jgi:hypothetical protein